MKFMKLGSRPDTFYTAESVRTVSSEVLSDLTIEVKGTKYLLHKFPLLSKCLKLQRLCYETTQEVIQLSDFPGGIEAFELCAKFCYGITITLSAYNIVAAQCAAEYLQMTEDVEKGNLMYKLQVFFNSYILQGWRDCVVTLQSTKAFPLWCEDLGITSRCVESVAWKVSTNPSKASLSHSHSRRVSDMSCNGTESWRHKPVTKCWWAEDMAELGIDLYWRTMIAIKSGGKIPSNLIGEALQMYASRWLPNISKKVKANRGGTSDSDSDDDVSSKHRLLLETIASLLPSEKGAVSCSFLLKLLKAANVLNVSLSSKMELARRVALQLEEARVTDLLIPSLSDSSDTGSGYDVDIVLTILEQFMLQGQSPPTSPPRLKLGSERRRRSRSAENIDFEFQESRRSSSASHSSKLKVAKIIDGYLQEIARHSNLPLSKFIAIAETIPYFSRLDHDDLYRAIDIYLKAHPGLNKSERKRLCRILDCKKLSVEACMHAAQNEKLPLRVVIQVLFFEQTRAAMAGGKVADLPSNLNALLAAHNIDPSRPQGTLSTSTSIRSYDQWSISGLTSPKSRTSTLRMKLAEDDHLDEFDVNTDGMGRHSKFKAFCALPTGPKKMFSKLLSINRSGSEKN
ncbi:BTB/POZ domain-containing protein [Hibiscus syriacus]|uniref:BTB/POZ domain-containing protein n=1 Tax=Hibiscus syriacus TaxID=106335 RepID=A0A6A3A3Q0_HIBSY|nr:BTB/POZ domain-containing protein At1g67900-like [Hibiscus syriacus]KAE8698950.1 BTB/POZ domain-containing protein [Hibiscus syriacus]